MTDVSELRDDELVWMRHTDPNHSGWFQCPAAAVEAWRARGWEIADPDERPVEPNPVVEERIAAEADLAATAEPADEAEAEEPPSTTRRTRRAASASQED